MLDLLADHQRHLDRWSSQGSSKRQQAHLRRGKMLGRERLELFLDQDSPFLEICPLLGEDQDRTLDGNPLVGGIGFVRGVQCVVLSYIPTVGTGSLGLSSGKKWNRLYEIALSCKLPFVQLLESSGADLDDAFNVFHTRPGPFYSLARMSKERVPSISVVFGTCVAGGAYLAGMSDYTIMVNENAHLALAGSRLVNVATGEVASEEDLGGARMHGTVSGSAEFVAENELEALAHARKLLAKVAVRVQPGIPSLNQVQRSNRTSWMRQDTLGYPLPPVATSDDLLGLISYRSPASTTSSNDTTTNAPSGTAAAKNAANAPAANKKPDPYALWREINHCEYDPRKVIAAIVDGSNYYDFKPAYGSTIVCAWASINSQPVGIVANQGVVLPASARKATHFITLCSQQGKPIIYLHNVTGFMVGQHYEREGMLKWGSQMINAMSNAEVPSITILVGSSFGAANFAMCGRGYYPRFIFAWPTARCAVMGSEQLTGVLRLLAMEQQQQRQKQQQPLLLPQQHANLASPATGLSDPTKSSPSLSLASTAGNVPAGSAPSASSSAKATHEGAKPARRKPNLHELKTHMDTEMTALYCTQHGLDDGIIDPRSTREVLAMCLAACAAVIPKPGQSLGLARL